MPPPIRALADRYLYDPVHIKVKSANLTVDSVEQFALEVKPADKADRLVEVLSAERPEQAIVFVRTKIARDQLYRKMRDRGLNVRALHGDMTQGQRDGVMLSFKGGRVPILVATDVAARGLDILNHHAVDRLRRSDLARTCTCTGSGGPGGSGAAGGRSPSSSRARVSELAAIEKHVGVPDHAVGRGRAHDARPGLGSARAGTPSRTSRAPATSRRAKLIAGVGRADSVEVSDLVHAVTAAAGIDGEAISDVRVLEHFSLLRRAAQRGRAHRRSGRRDADQRDRAPRRTRPILNMAYVSAAVLCNPEVGRYCSRPSPRSPPALRRSRRARHRPRTSSPIPARARASRAASRSSPARTGAWRAGRPPDAWASAPGSARR